jgi:hypothetical protein
MRPGIQGLLLSFILFFSIFFVVPVKGNNPGAASLYTSPREIQSPYKYSLSIAYSISNDSAFIQFRVIRTGTTSFGFGSSAFVINIDTSLYDLTSAKILKTGIWDATLHADYGPMTLSYNLKSQTLRVNIIRPTTTGTVTAPLGSVTDTLIAKVYVATRKCRGLTILSWNTSPTGTAVTNWLGQDITGDMKITDAIAYNTTCPCNAAWTGLDSAYCTASLLSRLTPSVAGGKFVGPGVNYAAGVWYFKAFDAGPGMHSISYILPCGDTLTKVAVVNAAPCITTSGKDSSSGFTYLPVPQGIYTDCSGEVFATSALDQKVYELDTFGTKHTIGGTGVAGYLDGPISTSQFNTPSGLTLDNSIDTNVYVIDSRNFCIRVINLRLNTVSTFAGTAQTPGSGNNTDDGTGLAAKFVKAVGIAFSTDYKNLYITENDPSLNVQRIRMINVSTKAVTTVAGGKATGDIPAAGGVVPGLSARFNALGNISCDSAFLYFADASNNKIRKMDLKSPTHPVQTVIGNSAKGDVDGDSVNARFDQPYSATIGVNGNIYVADKNNNLIREVTQYPKKFVTTISGYVTGGNTDSTFTNPVATSVFVKGFIDVADVGNDRIRRVAIVDYGNKPFSGFDTVFCYNGNADTLNYVVGAYTGPGNSVFQQGGRWVFDPKKVTPGTYRICYSFNLNNCNASFCKTIIVNPMPRPEFGKLTNVCANALDTFRLNAGVYKSYKWYQGLNPANIIPGQTNRYLQVNTAATYSVIVTDSNGCVGGDTTLVQPVAIAQISLGPDQYLCAGNNTVLSFTSSAGMQSALWQDSTTNFTDTAFGGGVYFVTVKDANGCFASDTLFVNSQLPPTPLITSLPAEKCVSFVKTDAVFGKDPSFQIPQLQGMVKDKLGNIYITDFENNLIRKIDLLGNKTIYAGGTGNDSLGTDISTVKLSGPYGITIDRHQNIYITEVLANIVRKITPAGKVSIYAGVYGSDSFNGDGRKDTVKLSQPTAIDIDDEENVYVTEYAKNIIRKISPLGFTQIIGDTTTSGDATGTFAKARFNKPEALTIDKGGYVYVADLNNTIKKINPFTRSVSVYSTLTGISSINVKGLAVDNLRRMYVSMNSNYTLYFIDPRDSTTQYHAGVINSGGTQDGLMTQAKFQDLQGLYIDENGGALYVIDKNEVRMVTDSCSVNICEDAIASLDVGPNYTSFQWDNDPSLNTRYLTAAATGNYFVRVTNANNCPFYDTIHINVYPKPLITVSNDTAVCSGSSASLFARIAPAGANDTITWKLNGVIINQTIGQAVNTIIGSTGGMYTATVTTGKNCIYSKQVNLKVNQVAVDAGPDLVLCTYATAALGVKVNGGNDPDLRYQWTGAGLSNDTIADPIVTPGFINDSLYIIKVTDSLGCTGSDTLLLHLRQGPVIHSIKDTLICSGNKVLMTTGISLGSQPYVFTWSPATGLNDYTAQNPTASPQDSTVYYVSATDKSGCRSNQDTVRIGVVRLSAVANALYDTVCPFASDTLKVHVLNGSGNYVYSWTPATGLNNPSLVNPEVKTDSGRTYTVFITDKTYQCPPIYTTVKLNVKSLFVNAGLDTSVCLGSALQLNTMVTGGSKPLAFSWFPPADLNDTKIQDPVVTPAAAGIKQYVVQVSGQDGCSNTDTIRINVLTAPSVFAGRDTAICQNTTTSLHAIATGGTQPYIFYWKNNLSGLTVIGNPVSAVLNDSSYYVVTTKDANQCSGTGDTVNVAVIKINAAATASPDTVCPSVPAQLNAMAKGGSGKYTFAWLPAGSLDNAAIAAPVATVSEATLFQVIVMDSLGCSDTATAKVNVVDLTLSAGPDLQICQSDSIQLNAKISGGKSPYKFQWIPASYLNRADIANPTAAPPAGNTRYIVQVEDQGGCRKQDTVFVMVTPFPIADAGPDTLIACATQPRQIGGNPTASGGTGAPYNISWSSPTQSGATLSDPSAANPLATPLATAMYYLSVADVKGCQSQDSVFIKVNPLPQTTITQDKAASCQNDTVTLSVNPFPGNYIFQWKEINTLALLGITDQLKAVSDGTYRVTIRNEATGCADSSQVTLNFIELPGDLSISSASVSCTNAPVLLQGNATGDSLTYSWTVLNGYGIFTSSTASSTQYFPNRNTDPLLPVTLEFQFRAQNGCSKDSVLQEVGLNPVVQPSFFPDTTKAFPGDVISFTNTTDTVSNSIRSFEWIFQDGSTSDTYNASHVYQDGGTYNAALVAVNYLGCADTFTVAIEVLKTQIVYVPNAFAPSENNENNKTAKVYGQNLVADGFEFSIYDRWGASVFDATDLNLAKSVGWNGTYKNNGDELPMGVYTYALKVKFRDGSKVNKTVTITLIR